jgi:predicted permease
MPLLRRVVNLFSRSRVDRAIDAEIQSHIELRIEDNLAAGMSAAEARRDALLRFGNLAITRERVASADMALSLEIVCSDLRYAARRLRQSPGFVLAAVLTLALAIGSNAVVFSVMNAFILRPLNVPQAESLYALQHGNGTSGAESYPNYLDLRDRNRSFDGLVAYNVSMAGLDTGGNPSSAWIEEASGNYFDALGLEPYLGHFFHAADEHGANSAPYIVLTYACWHTRFQDDRTVVGRVVRVNGHPFTILGVGPPDFHGTLLFFGVDFFVPLVEDPLLNGDDLNARGSQFMFETMGHLKPGVTPAQAVADLNAVGAYLQQTYPKDVGKMTFVLRSPSLYGDYLGRPVRAFMAGLMLLTGLILLAACANLGSLFAARAADRSREVALRLALGSSRIRILRGLFTEAILISLAGGGVGLLGSVVLLRALSAWRPFPGVPIQLAVNPDVKVYAVAVLLALASGLLFGAVPVRQVLQTNPYEVVKAGSSGRAGKRMSARDVLLVVEIAICAVLVTSSLVAVRGLVRSLHNHFGFEIENTMVASTDLSMSGYSPDRAPSMQKRMIEALEALPGVESVGLIDTLPLSTGGGDSIVFTDNAPDLRPTNAATDATMFFISPEYLHAAGTALLAGRAFTWQDDKNSPRVAVVNGEFARKLFGSAGNAVGHMYKLKDGTRIQVVGIAEDGKYNRLTEDPVPVMFLPILQSPSTSTVLVVRAREGENHAPQLLGTAMRNALRQLDTGMPLEIETRDKPMDVQLFGPRMATASLGVLGVMGAILSITGLFGMAAYSVGKRLKELGIRVALGARRREVLRAALGRAFRLLAIGSVAGLLLGILATRVLASIVFQATPRDPLVLAGVVLAMLLLGLVATWIPAQRALSIDPGRLLREE